MCVRNTEIREDLSTSYWLPSLRTKLLQAGCLLVESGPSSLRLHVLLKAGAENLCRNEAEAAMFWNKDICLSFAFLWNLIFSQGKIMEILLQSYFAASTRTKKRYIFRWFICSFVSEICFIVKDSGELMSHTSHTTANSSKLPTWFLCA